MDKQVPNTNDEIRGGEAYALTTYSYYSTTATVSPIAIYTLAIPERGHSSEWPCFDRKRLPLCKSL